MLQAYSGACHVRRVSRAVRFATAVIVPFVSLDAMAAQPVQRPGQEPLAPPAYEQPRETPDAIWRRELGASAMSRSASAFVSRYVFHGNSVVREEVLREIAAPFEGRVVTALELETLRRLITAHYVDRGFVNSGAFFPDQDLALGTVHVQIAEGTLTEIDITGLKSVPERLVRRPLEELSAGPLNVSELQSRLLEVERDPRIDRLDAELKPGPNPATGRLLLRVDEARPWVLGAGLANDRSPSVGESRLGFDLGHYNLTGRADELNLGVGTTEGLVDGYVRYSLPITDWSTRLFIGYDYDSADVVESPFDDLDIESRISTWILGLRHRIHSSWSSRADIDFRLEYRQSRSELLGGSFSFSSGAEDGQSTVTVARTQLDWRWGGERNAIGLRSTLSLGLDAFDSTTHSDGIEDSRYLAWLGQAVWAQRLTQRDLELVGRVDVQLANDALVPIEQFAIGGPDSVRGYRQNQLVRDGGAVGSLELRIPVWRTLEGRAILQVAGFLDYGRGWSHGRDDSDADNLAGAGVGLRWTVADGLNATVYWAAELEGVREPDDRSLQDRGITFAVSYRPVWN